MPILPTSEFVRFIVTGLPFTLPRGVSRIETNEIGGNLVWYGFLPFVAWPVYSLVLAFVAFRPQRQLPAQAEGQEIAGDP